MNHVGIFGALSAAAVLIGAGNAIGQVSYVSQQQSVATGIGFTPSVDVINSPGFGNFSATLDRTYETFPGFPDFTVRGIASPNSTLGTGQLRLTGRTDAIGSVFTGGGQVTGAVAMLRLDVVFDVSQVTPFSLFGSNSAQSRFEVPGASEQWIRLLRVDIPQTIVDRTYAEESIGPGGVFVPEMNDGPFAFAGSLQPGRYRLDIFSSQDSNGGSFFGTVNPNVGTLDVTLNVPTPGACGVMLAVALAATRRRR